MEAVKGNDEKEEVKPLNEDNERPKSLDLDAPSSRSPSITTNNYKKPNGKTNNSRKASPSSHEDESSSLNAEQDSLSIESQELEDIEQRSANRSSPGSQSWKSRIRDLSPSRHSPSSKSEGKTSKSKSPAKSPKSPAGWLPASFNQMFSSYKSRSGDFRRLFKDLPDSEQLIVDYSCALQRDILVHGRLYVSQNWLCFYANIFGWETFVTIKCTDIASIKKEKTALVIPNAVQINTQSEKYFFASFISRDTAFTVLFRIWQNALLSQPLTPSELIQMVGKYVESGREDSEDSDKDSRISSDPSGMSAASAGSDGEEDSETDDENDFELLSDDQQSVDKAQDDTRVNTSAFKAVASDTLSTMPELSVTPPSPTTPTQSPNSNADNKSSESSTTSRRRTKRTPSPVSKGPETKSLLRAVKRDKQKSSDTEDVNAINLKESSDMEEEGSVSEFAEEETVVPLNCFCDKHLALEMLDEELPLPVDRMYEILFTESEFYKRLQRHRKTRDLVFNPWTKRDNGQHRTLTYTVALNYSIGPKSSPTTETQHCFKGSVPGQVYMVQTEVNNEGIPYGDSFSVANRYCISKCTETSCRLRISSEIKYKKSVWGFVKNMIDKNASDGLKEYFTYLGGSLRKETELGNRTTKRRRSSPGKRHKRNRSLKNKEEIFAPPSSSSTLTGKVSRSRTLWRNTVSSILTIRSSLPSVRTESKCAMGIAVLLLFLLVLNVFLAYRLLALERGSQTRMDWARNIQNLPTDAKEWAQLLKQQKEIHEQEMERWKEILSTSIKLMNQVQDSLGELKKDI